MKPKHFHHRGEEDFESSYRKPAEKYHEKYHQAYYDDDPEASTSQQSYYDDDISELENSVLGHITNAAFSNHQFYDKRIPPESYGKFREDLKYRYDHEQPKSTYRTYDDHDFTRYKGNLGYTSEERPLRNPLHESQDIRDHYHEEEYLPERSRLPKSSSFKNYKYGQSNEDLNHYIQRRPQSDQQYRNEIKDDDYDYNRFRSYGARVPKREYFDEDHYYDNSPYQKNNYREPNPYRKERQTSVLDNIRENLPWPLSMVGRLGENDETSRSDENTFPDSIQSILKVIDSQNDVGKEYHDHKVLPFLDVEEIK